MSPYVSTSDSVTRIIADRRDTTGAAERVSAKLALTKTAPGHARRILDAALAEWGLGHLADAADLITSELVTNAVVHGIGPAGIGFYTDRTADGGLLFIEVEDSSSALPQARPVGEDDEAGRGLVLVDALAEDWGCEPLADGQRKRVWASLALTGASTAV